MKIFKWIAGFFLLLVLAAGAGWYVWLKPAPDFGRAVLVFSKTAEFRHESIAAGIVAIKKIGLDERFNIVATEDPSQFADDSLANFHAVIFLNTTGDVLNPEQQQSFERYIQAGGGFVGIHSAADTEWKDNSWPWYTRLVGAAFLAHPSDPSNVQPGILQVENAEHPATRELDASWHRSDEWYDFQRFNDRVNVLLTVDNTSYQGAVTKGRHPMAWFHDYDGGRAFYTGLGHTAESFSEKMVLSHLAGGIRYAMGDGDIDYSRARPEPWRLRKVILDSNLNEPMAMAFRPDGALYYIQRGGGVRRYDFETKQSVVIADLDVYGDAENGLIGITFDPGFESNQWVYLFRALDEEQGAAHVLSRFKLQADVLDLTSEQQLLAIPIERGNTSHTGGTLQFDNKGQLWISTGDNTNPHESGGYSPHDDRAGRAHFDAARSAGNSMDLRGKILRIIPSADAGYTIPEGNLFTDARQGRPEIYAMGLRNPFRMYVDSKTETLYWGEVGPDARDHSASRGPWGYDEFNRTGKPGNFGWPFVIGDNEPYAQYDFAADKPGEFVDPAAPENRSANNTGMKILPPAQPAWIAYPYLLEQRWLELGEGGRSAMVGQVYYHNDYPDNPVKLPRYYDGQLFIYEWVRRWIKTIAMDARGEVTHIAPFMDGAYFSAPIDLKFAPDGSLYVLEYGSAWFAQNEDAYLTRIEYYGDANPLPEAHVKADKLVGAVPLTVSLSGAESFDRNSDRESLKFRWELLRGGKSVRVIAETATTTFVAQQPGDYHLRLTVTDVDGASSEAGVVVKAGNEPPQVDVQFSGNSSFYWPDRPLEYRVSASDLEDGTTDSGIDPQRVVVTMDYLPEGFDRAAADAGHKDAAAMDGYSAMEGSDCLACHTRDRASVGPSFTAISDRYRGVADADKLLIDKVLNGGGGSWGQHAMPPHPQLSADEAGVMVAWILDPEASIAVPGALPLQGRLTFDRHLDRFVDVPFVGKANFATYVFNASYKDRGALGMPAQTARAKRMLRYPLLMANAFDQLVNGIAMPIPSGFVDMEGMEAMHVAVLRNVLEAEKSSYAVLRQIDLNGISKIRVGLTTSRLFTTGGDLALRLDSVDGPLIGLHKIEIANLGVPSELEYYEFELKKISAVHDLLLLSTAAETSERARPSFIILSVEFIAAQP